jgi:hypothetical protein
MQQYGADEADNEHTTVLDGLEFCRRNCECVVGDVSRPKDKIPHQGNLQNFRGREIDSEQHNAN